jgi:hypothetical protein
MFGILLDENLLNCHLINVRNKLSRAQKRVQIQNLPKKSSSLLLIVPLPPVLLSSNTQYFTASHTNISKVLYVPYKRKLFTSYKTLHIMLTPYYYSEIFKYNSLTSYLQTVYACLYTPSSTVTATRPTLPHGLKTRTESQL